MHFERNKKGTIPQSFLPLIVETRLAGAIAMFYELCLLY